MAKTKIIPISVPVELADAFDEALREGENRSRRIADLMRADIRRRTGKIIAKPVRQWRPKKHQEEK